MLRYCNRSCRQRAYEVRTASRRLRADVAAGVVRAEPAERVVERVVQRRYPQTAGEWELALQELAAQLADGRLAPWHASRLRRALAQAEAAAGVPAGATPRQGVGAAAVRFSPVAIALWETVVRRVQIAGGVLSVTLEGLAGSLGAGVDEVRAVLVEAERLGYVVVQRRGTVVAVAGLAVHARCDLVVR